MAENDESIWRRRVRLHAQAAILAGVPRARAEHLAAGHLAAEGCREGLKIGRYHPHLPPLEMTIHENTDEHSRSAASMPAASLSAPTSRRTMVFTRLNALL